MKTTTTFLAAAFVAFTWAIPREASAQCLAGETAIVIEVTTASFPNELVWTLIDDATGDTVIDRTCGSYTLFGEVSSDTVCLSDGQTYTFNAYDDWGDGWNGGSYVIKRAADGCVLNAGSPDNGLAGDGTDVCDAWSLEESFNFLADFIPASCVPVSCGAGETKVVIDVVPAGFPAEIFWTLTNDATGDTVAQRICGSYGLPSADTVCLLDGQNYTLNCYDDYGDGWNDGTYTITRVSDGCLIRSSMPDNGIIPPGPTGGCDGVFELEEAFSFDPVGAILGCTDPLGLNYNPCASIDDGSCLLPSANDECASAIVLPLNTDGTCTLTATGSLIGASYSAASGPPSATCVDGDPTPLDIWFKVGVPASGNVQITTIAIPGFSILNELYSGSCGSLTMLPAPCVNYTPGGILTVGGLTPGDTVWVRTWDFASDDIGLVTLCAQDPVAGCTEPCASNYDPLAVIDDGSCILPPSGGGEACPAAVAVTAGTWPFYTGASDASYGPDPTSCTFNDSIDIFFAYAVPPGVDSLKISTCVASFDTGLSIWDDCPDSGGSEIACNDDDLGTGGAGICGGGLSSSIALPLAAYTGTTLYIRVTGYNGQSGCGDLLVEEVLGSGCDISSAPINQVSTVGAASVTLSWDVISGSVACQVKARPLGASTVTKANLFVSDANSLVVGPNALMPGTTYGWKVRCACSLSPALFTPLSVGDTFTVPVIREGVLDAASTVFPNPASDWLYVNHLMDQDGTAVSFEIVDLMGRVRDARSIDLGEGLNQLRFDVSELEQGAYFVRISRGGIQPDHIRFTVTR